MKARVSCNCHDHMLEFSWEQNDSYVTVGFWTRTRNWMDFWTRIKKAWEVLIHGSALIDDVYIASPQDAADMAEVLLTYVNAELKRRDAEKLPPPLAAAMKRAAEDCMCGNCGKPTLPGLSRIVAQGAAAETQVNPASLIGEYLSKGVVRKPLPKTEE